jgi:tetratricopeptide (TPR) repeat protein
MLLLLAVAAAAGWLEDARIAGAALEAAGRREAAADLYRSALLRLGDAPPEDRFWFLSSLAELAFDGQDYREARRWLTQAESVVDALPVDAPERARLLNNRASLLLVEGKLTAAEAELAHALALLDVRGAPLDLAAALHNLAAVEMQTGRLAGAAAREQRALELWREHLGERHPRVAKGWISLSTLQALSGDWRAAETSLRAALAIGETPEALSNYAVVLDKLRRGREAAAIRRRVAVAAPAALPLVDVKARPHEASRPAVHVR